MSVEAAQRGYFAQAERFDEVVLALNPDQKQAVTQLAGPQPPHRSLRAWKAMRGSDVLGYVFVDEVLGRQDMITYAVAIDASGRMTPIEVLSYRESHGSEIRGTAWRRQFDGRQGLDHLRFGTDIKNIAGATLSCEHVTQGVRWISALWQVTLRTAPTAASAATPVRATVAADVTAGDGRVTDVTVGDVTAPAAASAVSPVRARVAGDVAAVDAIRALTHVADAAAVGVMASHVVPVADATTVAIRPAVGPVGPVG
jgi:hypothetical protein